ncbi:MAG: DUF2813 domain-containing protein [Phycisphaerae bacterium]|nr:DUF2813 domain-containing protein [Phycisphaerae bacterium]
MLLAHVEVSNYRGIRFLALPIGPTTSLIGENAYGKSNLLDALLVCLGIGAVDGEFAFQPGDFRVCGESGLSPENSHEGEPCEPIEILLGFREHINGECEEDPECAALRPYVYPGKRGDRRISFVVRAELGAAPATGSDGGRPITVKLRFLDADRRQLGPLPDRSIVTLLRHRVPFVMLKADRYFVRPSRSPAEPTQAISGIVGGTSRPVDLEARLAAEVSEAFSKVSDMHRPIDERWVARGLDAAERYLERFGGERLKRRLGHFFSSRIATTGGTGVSGGARSIALLLIFGSLFDARAEKTFGKGARPVIAIEDAEAYLHPVILASVAALIDAMPTQKLITTNSGELLSLLPLHSLRRLVRRADRTDVYRLGRDTLSDDELRRIGYHVRAIRGTSLFARCWLLVEGETEFWLLPELAAVAGHDFALEGVRLMEFAQCGVAPLIKLADDLGIAWHLIADGDQSGQGYANIAASELRGRDADEHITRIQQRDIEHLLWASGFADVYRGAIPSAMPRRFDRRPRVENPTPTIERAIRARSKPGMALEVAEAAQRSGSPGVPQTLRHAIERAVELARRVSN